MKSHFYKNLVFLSATKDYCKSPNFNAYKSIKIWRFAMVFVMLALFLSSCASDKKELKNASSEYKEAMELLNDKNNIEAAEKFEAIYDDYPLSKWSIKAQAIAAYIYYGEKRYDDTIRIAETFVQLNPASEYVSYLQYMKAMSYFQLIPNVTRAQDSTKLASNDFRGLIARFPNSQYAPDAIEKILTINEYLAGFHVTTGKYQMDSQNYVGAIMHFSNAIYFYPKTNHAQEAYFRLYEVYYKLGMDEISDKVKKEMLAIYPDSIWAKSLPNTKSHL